MDPDDPTTDTVTLMSDAEEDLQTRAKRLSTELGDCMLDASWKYTVGEARRHTMLDGKLRALLSVRTLKQCVVVMLKMELCRLQAALRSPFLWACTGRFAKLHDVLRACPIAHAVQLELQPVHGTCKMPCTATSVAAN